MPNKARKYHYAESLTTSTNATVTDTVKVTLTFTPDANSTYAYIWNCDIAGTVATSLDAIVKLKNNAGTVLSQSNYEPNDNTNYVTTTGLAFETFGASPTSQSITLTFAAETTSQTASIRNARIIAIKLTSADSYAENTSDQTTSLASQVNALTLSITPSSAGSYLILGSCEARSSSTTVPVITQIAFPPGDGNNVDLAYSSGVNGVNDTTNYNSVLMQAAVGSFSTTKSVRLQFFSNTAGTTVNCRRARLLALRLDEFSDAYASGDDSSAPNSTTTTSTTYVTKKTSGAVTAISGLDYLVIGTAAIAGGSTTISAGYGLSVDGTYTSEAFVEAFNGTTLSPGIFSGFTVKTATTSSITTNLNYKAETGAVSAGASYATISVLTLDPADLYWVGGTGTWNSSNTTNWALSSGGTGGVAAPKASTNVYFDANSEEELFATTTYTVSSTYTSNNPPTYQYMNDSNANGSTNNNQWGSNSEANPFIKADLGSTQTLSRIVIGYDYLSNLPGSWGVSYTAGLSVQTSTDNTNWTTQATTPTYAASGSTNGLVSINLSGINARYVRLTKASGFMCTLEFQVWVSTSAGSAFTTTVGTGAVCKNLTISGLESTMTLSGTAALSVYGSFSVPATNFTQSYTGTITFAGTGSQTITTNGKSFTAFTFDGVGGTWTLQDAATITGAATLTNGTLALSSYTFTCDTFASNNSNTRTINFGTGKIVITDDATATVWNTATITNLTISGTPLVELTGGGATTKTISAGALSEANSISFSLLNTAGTVAFTASNTVKNLIIGNNSFTVSNIAITIYGNLTIGGTSPTLTAGTNAWTFAATSGTKTITTNSGVLDFPITFNGVGGTWALQDAMNIGSSSSRTLTHTAGTLDLSSYTLTLFGVFSGSGSGTRRLQMSGTGGKIVLSLNTATTVWDTTTVTNFTTDNNVLVQLTGGGATTKTISAGALSEANSISFQLSCTAGSVAFTANNTVENLTIDNNSFTLTNIAIIIYGNLTIGGTTPTLTAGTNAWTFGGSGTQTITTNGEVLDFPVTFSGTGTYALGSALSVGTATSRTVTLTSGTLNLANYTLTIYGIFFSSNSNVRTLAFGSTGKIVLTLAVAGALTTSTSTNMTVTGTNPLVQLIGVGTSSLTFGSHTESNSISVQLSPASTSTVTVSGSIRDLTIDNNAITLANSARTLFGNFTVSGTTPTLTAGASVTTFAATSGTKTINLNGNASNTIDFPITFNGVGGTWQLQHALNIGTATARTVTLTNGALDLAGYTFTIFGAFVSTGSAARTIAFGSTGKIVLSTTSAVSTTICNVSDTNLTVTGTNPLVQLTGSGTGPLGISGTGRDISLQLSPASSGTFSVNGNINNFTLDNTANITLNNTTRSIYGNFTISGTSPTLVTGADATTFAATSGTKTITTNGKDLNFPLTFNGVGGTWQLQNALVVGDTTNVGRQVTLTNGTLDLNNYTFTIYGSFVSTNSNTRTIAFGSSGKFNLALPGITATTIWNCATSTNLSVTGTSLVEVTGAGNYLRTISPGDTAFGVTESNAINFSLLSSAGSISISGAIKNLTVSCSGTTVNYGTITIYGNLTYTAGTQGGGGAFTFAATSGTQTINTNNVVSGAGVTGFYNFIINSSSTVQLASSLTLTGSFTLTAGTFDAVTYNVTALSFNSNNSNVRTLSMGSGTWTSPTTDTFWNFNTTTNLTFNKGTANIVNSSPNSGSVTRFNGGGLTYNNVTLSNNTQTRLDIYGNNTFNTLSVVAGASLRFEAGSTNTFTAFSFGNNSGDISALDTTTAGVAATLVYAGSSKIRTNYVTVRDITGSPVDTWYMGPNSTNTSNNTNLYFYNPPLYWIGGSGTWDNTSTTNWSFFSGGSSAGFYPDQYTDVIFDSNSDSGSSFNVISGTNVAIVCRDFTVSTLDNAMTFRVVGSSNTLSIYGNYSTPASNFSYTGSSSVSGSIVFVSTSTGKTITTNGVSFLEVEFNGVGGGWTLQDNMTVSGDSGFLYLTAGTITLNDKILTAGQFWITGTTARSIAFGTSGKLVHTSNQVWRGTTLTNFTATGNKRVEFTSSSFSRLDHGDTTGITELNALDVYITNLTGNVLLLGGVRNLDFTGSTGGWTEPSSAATLRIYGNLTVASGMSFDGSGRSGVLSFLGTVANGQTYQYITTNGLNIDFATITFNGTSQYVLLDQFSCGTSSANATDMTLSTGTIVMGNYNIVHYGIFTSSTTSTRSITSTGGVWKLTNNLSAPTIVWNTSTMTNMTTSNVTVEIYGTNDGVTRTVTPGSTNATESNAISFVIAATGSDTTVISAGAVRNITFNNTAYTISSTTLIIYGDLTIVGSTPTLSSSASVWTFAGTTGTQTITTNGVNIDRPLTFSGTGTYSLGSALTVGTSTSRIVTLTTGTLELNSYTLTIYGSFLSTGAGTRRIQMSGSGGKIVTSIDVGTTVWNTGTVTNMTTDGNISVQLTGGGATTKIINSGALNESNAINFQLSTTAGTVTFTANNTVKNLTIDNNSFTVSNIAITIFGNLLISGTSPTLTAGANAWTFAATSGTKTITTNNASLNSIIKQGASTLQLQDSLTAYGTLTHTEGTISIQGFTLTASIYSSSNSNTRSISFTSGGTFILYGSGTVWDVGAGTNFTMSGVEFGTISLLNDYAVKTFAGAGLSYCKLDNSGKSNLTITGNNTFYGISSSARPSTLLFQGGSTQTFSNNFNFGSVSSSDSINTYAASFSSGQNIDYTAFSINDVTGYTVEFFIKFNELSTNSTMTPLTSGFVNSPSIQANTTTIIISNAGYSVRGSNTFTLTTNTWYHIAYVGIGNTHYIGVDGVMKPLGGRGGDAGFTADGIWDSQFRMGGSNTLISNFRISTNGTIYSTNATGSATYTPPTAPNQLDLSTSPSLLTLRSPIFTDLSSSARTITTTGNPTLSTTTIGPGSAVTASSPNTSSIIITSTNTTPHTLTKTFASDVTVQYSTISYSTVDATGWYAYNSNDGGNNTNWIFVAVSAGTGNMFLMFY